MLGLTNCFSLFRRKHLHKCESQDDSEYIEMDVRTHAPALLLTHYSTRIQGEERKVATESPFELQFISFNSPLLPSSLEVQGACESFEELLKHEASTKDWKLKLSKSFAKVYLKKDAETGLHIVKALFDMEINVTPERMYSLLYDVDTRKEWDGAVVTEYDILEAPAQDLVHYYMLNKVPWPLADRDFVEKRYTRRREDGDIEVFYTDCPHHKYPDLQLESKVQRGHTVFGGQVFRNRLSKYSGEPTLLVTIVSQADIKGKVPPKIIKQTLPMSLLKWYRNVKKALTKAKE